MATEPRREAALGRTLEAGEPNVRQTFFALARKSPLTTRASASDTHVAYLLTVSGVEVALSRPILVDGNPVFEPPRPSLNPAAWEPAFSGANPF